MGEEKGSLGCLFTPLPDDPWGGVPPRNNPAAAVFPPTATALKSPLDGAASGGNTFRMPWASDIEVSLWMETSTACGRSSPPMPTSLATHALWDAASDTAGASCQPTTLPPVSTAPCGAWLLGLWCSR